MYGEDIEQETCVGACRVKWFLIWKPWFKKQIASCETLGGFLITCVYTCIPSNGHDRGPQGTDLDENFGIRYSLTRRFRKSQSRGRFRPSRGRKSHFSIFHWFFDFHIFNFPNLSIFICLNWFFKMSKFQNFRNFPKSHFPKSGRAWFHNTIQAQSLAIS